MLCLHHVPRSGIIWFSSVLAGGPLPIPIEDWLWSSSSKIQGGAGDKISGLDRF